MPESFAKWHTPSPFRPCSSVLVRVRPSPFPRPFRPIRAIRPIRPTCLPRPLRPPRPPCPFRPFRPFRPFLPPPPPSLKPPLRPIRPTRPIPPPLHTQHSLLTPQSSVPTPQSFLPTRPPRNALRKSEMRHPHPHFARPSLENVQPEKHLARNGGWGTVAEVTAGVSVPGGFAVPSRAFREFPVPCVTSTSLLRAPSLFPFSF